MKFIVTALILLIQNNVYAITSEDLLHPVAHGAGSYVITHVSEVVCRKLINMNKLSCSIVGGVLATSAGMLVESTQHESRKDHAKSYIENTTGILLAIGVINVDF